MKTRIITAVLAMSTVMAFAQKKEIRKAEGAVEDGNYAEAKAFLSQAEPLISGAKDKDKEKFYFNKGLAFYGDGENVTTEDLETAATAFQEAGKLGNEEAKQAILNVRNSYVNSAIDDEATQNYTDAYKKLYAAYELNKEDMIYLYFAANYAYNAQELDTALGYYLKLQELGYSGVETQYKATNVETGEVELFDKALRDTYVRAGTHADPKDEKTESKVGEIAKSIATIYLQKGDKENALAAVETAKKENPDDVPLLLTEAQVYYELGDLDKYQELIQNILTKDPNNATLYYNLGVAAGERKDNEKAIEYYNKAIEIEPSMINAYNNIAFTILDKVNPIATEMNSLGMSAADNKKYDELQKQLISVYEDAIVYLEKSLEINPSIQTADTMVNIYNAINQPEKAAEVKKRADELRAAQAGQ